MVVITADLKTKDLAVVPLAHARQLPPAERMERMRDPHKARCWDRSICILN